MGKTLEETTPVLVSVVIPVYNCEKFVEDAVYSILNQPLKSIRIVLVNDGSTDRSAEICDKLCREHDRVDVIHQNNCGVSAARNAGIEFLLTNSDCKDGYVAFLDADDAWTTDFFNQDTVELLQRDYDLVGFQTCKCNLDLSRRTLPIALQEGEYSGGSENVWVHSSQTFGAMLYRLQLLDHYNIRFKIGLTSNEDRIFAIICHYLANRIYLENKILYLYRNNPTSASHRKWYGIEKYTPMLEAWMNLDEVMEAYKTGDRGELREGHKMCAVYIVDMLEEHYQHFGGSVQLKRFFEKHPHYLELMDSSLIQMVKVTYDRWQRVLNHPTRFRVKCYVRSIVFSLVGSVYRFLYSKPSFRRMIDKKRYPVVI